MVKVGGVTKIHIPKAAIFPRTRRRVKLVSYRQFFCLYVSVTHQKTWTLKGSNQKPRMFTSSVL